MRSQDLSWSRRRYERPGRHSGHKKEQEEPGSFFHDFYNAGVTAKTQHDEAQDYLSEPDRTYVTLGSLSTLPDLSPDRHFSYEEHVPWLKVTDDLPRFRGKSTTKI